MYQCVFIKYLWKDAETKKKRLYQTLEKELRLPFPPDTSHEFTHDSWFSGQIERIVWDYSAEVFKIKVVDAIPSDSVSAELLSEIAIKQGWSVQAKKK